METNAVPCEVGVIFPYGTGNAGVHVEEMPPLQFLFQCIVEQSADTLPLPVLFHIDRRFHRPVIGGTFVEFSGVGVPHRHAVLFCHQIGVVLQGVRNAAGEFRLCGNIVLECNGGLLHIRGINGKQCRCICWHCRTELNRHDRTSLVILCLGYTFLRKLSRPAVIFRPTKKQPPTLDSAEGCFLWDTQE